MWLSGNFRRSMFYFALKIKRPEVASTTYLRPTVSGASPETSAQWKKLLLYCERLGVSYAPKCSQTQGAASKGDIYDYDQTGGQSGP
jgi:hypothetical protein